MTKLDLSSELSIENLVETTSTNSHWDGLKGILNQEGKFYEGLSEFEKEFYTNYLSQKVKDVDGIGIPFIVWLKTNRIELNTILAIAKPEPFWNWLKYKLLKLWPDRNYNRVISKPSPDEVYTPAVKDFITRLDNTFKPLIDSRYTKIEKQLNKIKYFIKDTDRAERMIQSCISTQITNEEDDIIRIDRKLEAFADKLNLASIDESEG